MFSSLILHSNKKFTNWISTGMPFEKNELFDTNLEPTMFNLANGRVILKSNNPDWVPKIFSSFYSNFILDLYIVYELNTWPRNPTNNVALKNCLFGTVKLTRNADESKFCYNGWRIAFEGKQCWSFHDDTTRNVVIFGVDNSSSCHIDKSKK